MSVAYKLIKYDEDRYHIDDDVTNDMIMTTTPTPTTMGDDIMTMIQRCISLSSSYDNDSNTNSAIIIPTSYSTSRFIIIVWTVIFVIIVYVLIMPSYHMSTNDNDVDLHASKLSASLNAIIDDQIASIAADDRRRKENKGIEDENEYEDEYDQDEQDEYQTRLNFLIDTSPPTSSMLTAFSILPSHSSSCPPLFPRPPSASPTSSYFVTSLPNRGAGVGHQFGEWVYGPWLAATLNISYVHAPFSGNSKRWTGFMGFGDGEDTREDVELLGDMSDGDDAGEDEWHNRFVSSDDTHNVNSWSSIRMVMRTQEEDKIEPSSVWIPRMMALEEKRALNASLSLSADSSSSLLHPSSSRSRLSPRIPYPILFALNEVHVPDSRFACQPSVHALIRSKYCAARRSAPLFEDLYADDRRLIGDDADRMPIVVAMHMRCGDSCYDPYRATSFTSLAVTIHRVGLLLHTLAPARPMSLHMFSQRAVNNTAESHFAPLIDAIDRQSSSASTSSRINITTHWTTGGSSTMHHFVMCDVLIGSQSSFSWLGFMLHRGINLGPVVSCENRVDYDKVTGGFDEVGFEREWNSVERRVGERRKRGERTDACADEDREEKEKRTMN